MAAHQPIIGRMGSFFPRLRTFSGVGLLCAAAFVLIVAQAVWASTTQETCADSTAIACGNQGYPPGPYSICSSTQVGKACNSCNGTTGYRYCGSSTQQRVCTAQKPLPTCGKPFTGVCTKYYYGIPITGPGTDYWLCPATTAGGTQSCSVSQACTGDAPRPKG